MNSPNAAAGDGKASTFKAVPVSHINANMECPEDVTASRLHRNLIAFILTGGNYNPLAARSLTPQRDSLQQWPHHYVQHDSVLGACFQAAPAAGPKEPTPTGHSKLGKARARLAAAPPSPLTARRQLCPVLPAYVPLWPADGARRVSSGTTAKPPAPPIRDRRAFHGLMANAKALLETL